MMRIATHALGLLAAASILAPAVGAQDARLSQRLDARSLAAVTRVLDSARAQSLPTEPLVQKALQGATKRAPAERIVAAVRELRGELSAAREALGARSTEAELVAGAGALHAGIAASALTRLRAARGTQSATVAIGTLSDLVARGVPVDGALSAMLTLAARGTSDGDIIGFSNQVGRDIAAGAPPAVAARVRSAAAAQGVRPATGRPATAPPRASGGRPSTPPPRGRP